MNATESLLLGVVAGIITSLVLYALKALFTTILIPKFEDLRYKGVRLDGEWRGNNDTSDFKVDYRLLIKQNAHRVSGRMQITKTGKNIPETENLEFKIEGTVWEGFLNLGAWSMDSSRLGFGADLLQIKEGGRKLEGIHVYRSLRRDCVAQLPLSLKKNEGG